MSKISDKIVISTLFCTLFFASCKRLSFDDDPNIIAKIGKEKLYKQEVEQMIKTPLSPEDSLAFMADYAEMWIKRELKRQNAEEFFTDKTIEKMVEEYRASLLTYKYEQRYTSTVSDMVSNTEISEFYNANKENFLLSTPMVKARVLRVPAGYKNRKQITKKMNSSNSDDMLDVVSMADKDALQLYDFSKKWYYFDEVIDYMPFVNKNESMDSFLENNRNLEVSSSDYVYLLQIFEYKKTGSVMPAEFLEDQIRKIIINNRKMKILSHIEDSLYRVAIEDNSAYNRFLHSVDSIAVKTTTKDEKK